MEEEIQVHEDDSMKDIDKLKSSLRNHDDYQDKKCKKPMNKKNIKTCSAWQGKNNLFVFLKIFILEKN